MTRISSYQLFSIIVLFQFGTTIIFGFASGAGRDAWIAATISMMLGMALIYGYTVIAKRNGNGTLVQWIRGRFGKLAGTPIAWMYPLLFIYDAGRGIADLKFLVPLTLLPHTPILFFTAMFVLLVVYVMYAGIEVLSRVAGFLLPVLICFIVLETLLLWASGSLHPEYIRPFVGDGTTRIAKNVWPIGVTQTYGESIEMAVFWCMLTKPAQLSKVAVGATFFAGMFIILFDLLAVMALGEHVFQELVFPAFTILKLSSIADFLENLDALGALYFMCTAFVKVSVHMIVALLCIRELTGTGGSNSHMPIWLIAIAVYAVGMTMARSFTEHLKVGFDYLPSLLWVPLFIGVPLLLLLLSWKRKSEGGIQG